MTTNGQPLLKAAYPTIFNPYDVRKWSGLIHFIAQALEDQQIELTRIGPLQRHRRILNAARGKVQRTIFRTPFPVERTMKYAEACARTITEQTSRIGSQVIFSPSSIPVALLKHKVPTVIYTDATYSIAREQYRELRDQPERYLREGMELEHQAMQNAAAIVFSSRWAARSAVDHHGADPSKVHVVPFGSNLNSSISAEAVHRAIAERSKDRCELLFVAVRWKSKGGDLVLRIADLLWQKGVPARVTLVGSEPEGMTLPAHVESIGFIDKSAEQGQRQLMDLMLRSHFLVLPTRIDCTPVVFSEAAAMGLPCLSSSSVGGISEIIRSGINGNTFDLNDAEGYADFIAEQWNSPNRYEALAYSSREEHEQRLNWRTGGKALRKIMQDVADDRTGSTASQQLHKIG